MKRELLDDMARMSGCLYLSDLRTKQGQRLLKQTLGRVDHEGYSVEEWQDAVAYVTRARPPMSRSRDGYQFLWNWLNGMDSDETRKVERMRSHSATGR